MARNLQRRSVLLIMKKRRKLKQKAGFTSPMDSFLLHWVPTQRAQQAGPASRPGTWNVRVQPHTGVAGASDLGQGSERFRREALRKDYGSVRRKKNSEKEKSKEQRNQ